jgi:hypothetical protein
VTLLSSDPIPEVVNDADEVILAAHRFLSQLPAIGYRRLTQLLGFTARGTQLVDQSHHSLRLLLAQQQRGDHHSRLVGMVLNGIEDHLSVFFSHTPLGRFFRTIERSIEMNQFHYHGE